MAQFYSDESRESDKWSLPDAETFYRTSAENRKYGNLDGDGKPMPAGWYYWFCFPGCLPEGDPSGPYKTEQAAIEACRRENGD